MAALWHQSDISSIFSEVFLWKNIFKNYPTPFVILFRIKQPNDGAQTRPVFSFQLLELEI
jgi:hypothetical protein